MKNGVAQLTFHDIEQHILDPQKYPLDIKSMECYNRVLAAAQLMDDYPEEFQLVKMLKAKFRCGELELRRNIRMARELFKTKNEIDYDFWLAWRIRDVLELLRRAKLQNNLKMWNEAHKTLIQLIGEKPSVEEDPRRMEKNVFFIQVNNATGQPVNIPLEKIRGLNQKDLNNLFKELDQPIDENQAKELFES